MWQKRFLNAEKTIQRKTFFLHFLAFWTSDQADSSAQMDESLFGDAEEKRWWRNRLRRWDWSEWQRESRENRESQKKQKRLQYCTFLQAHVYHSRLCQLQEEVLVFLILLIVNNFHVNKFAVKGRKKGGGGRKRAEEDRERRRERLILRWGDTVALWVGLVLS